ncbi:DMT family transporter [Flagellimonas sp.]|uniref:DMT family transporter n=1 Tax=Flagellimonas sp. TaxID=2058762 RepID=UPI003B5C87CE
MITLSMIWGTSYILIKKGLEGFTPIQLGAIRAVLSTFFLFVVGFKSMRTISKKEWFWVGVSGVIGSFIPMFLFAFAETEIDSSIASILNSLVPLFTLFIGLFAFGIGFTRNQLLGVFIGLIGAAFLIFFGTTVNPDQNYWYAGFVIVATICYACNANIIKSKLQNVSPMGIAVGNFAVIFIPGLIVLLFSGFMDAKVVTGSHFFSSLGYIAILCIISTCVAKIMFNRLVQISTAVFSVSVTYLIPIVGIFWGLMDGERFTLWQFMAALVILLGVYMVNKKKTPQRASLSNKN